ncbi:MAG: type II toxin-antitoxin system antitoxin SocA domain-containing protein [Gallionella sp.]|jgi:uncharacterized phage-associated protein
MAATIDDVADYIIVKLDEARSGLSILKLQKLVYYVQAWNMALKGRRLFDGKFEAWVHGPVNRSLYVRFAGSHSMYDLLNIKDVRPSFNIDLISNYERLHIDDVLDAYVRFSGPQLESMTHDEAPWRQARGTLKLSERCEVEIDETLIASFYKKMLEDAEV